MRNQVQTPLAAAAGCAFAFAFVLILAYALGPTERLDVRAFDGFATLRADDSIEIAEALARSGDPGPLLVILAGICALGLYWRRPWEVGAAIVTVMVSAILAQTLKVVLAHERAQPVVGGGIDAAAFPSGHATASTSLAIALVLVAPGHLRPVAAVLGAFYALGASLSIVILGGHYPTDVVGGMLLATGLGLVALAGLRRFAGHGDVEPSREDASAWVLQFILVCAGTFLFVLAISRVGDALDFAGNQTVAAITGALVAGAAALLIGMFALFARE